MSDDLPILEGKPLTDEQKRLIALFDEMKKNQLTFLDEAGKRIIELSTGLLGVLFAVIAFGKDFPPPYLQHNPQRQGLAVAVLVAFALAVLASVCTIQPRGYTNYEHNLSGMREELGKMLEHKAHWMKIATCLFGIGTTLLAWLIGSLVLAS